MRSRESQSQGFEDESSIEERGRNFRPQSDGAVDGGQCFHQQLRMPRPASLVFRNSEIVPPGSVSGGQSNALLEMDNCRGRTMQYELSDSGGVLFLRIVA